MMKLILRPPAVNTFAPQVRLLLACRRSYATHNSQGASSSSKRKSITPLSDDGQVPWRELSAAEKTARATQQTVNFGMVMLGIALTGGVAYFLYQDVFSPESKTAYFSRAVDQIKKHPDCVAALGDGKKITAHGEETANKWRRARPIASTHKVDGQRNEHIILHFYLEGPLNKGVANAHLTKRAGAEDFEYKYLYVDVPGHSRIVLENADTKSMVGQPKKFKMFGVHWN